MSKDSNQVDLSVFGEPESLTLPNGETIPVFRSVRWHVDEPIEAEADLAPYNEIDPELFFGIEDDSEEQEATEETVEE